MFLGFLFILFLGRKYGAGSETDIYFLSMVIVSYLGYFVQAVWEAMSPYYINLRLKNKVKSNLLYSILLNDIIILSIVVIGIYFVVTNSFIILSDKQKDFLDIFILYIIFQNILYINKIILNLEHFYASYYFVDIFVYLALFLTALETNKLIYLAYTIVFATLLANIWQFYLIFKKVGIKYHLKFYDRNFNKIYRNSFKIKLGSLFYGSKDIIMATVFTNFSAGTYSLYNYANKFSGIILQVVNAPIVNIYVTKANYFVANKEYHKLQESIKRVLMQTLTLFAVSASTIYLLLPYILGAFFGSKFSESDILMIQNLFSIIIIFALVVVIESPFARLINIVKNFNYGLFLNILFFVIMFIGYLIFKLFGLTYYWFLYILIFAQFSNLILAYLNYKSFVRKNFEI